MYEEAEYRFDWSGVMFKILFVVAALVIAIVLIFIFSSKSNISTDYFKDNMNTMVSVAKNYYSSNNINEKITLEEMIDKKMIIDFIDEDGNTCDAQNSYATLNNNKITVNLVCNKQQEKVDVNR